MKSEMSLKALLALMASATVLLLAILAGTGLFEFKRMTDDVAQNHVMVEQLARFNNAIQSANLHFKIQVQDWKNILLRGNDAGMYAKYTQAFDSEDAQVDALLKEAVEEARRTGLPFEPVVAMLNEHTQLRTNYLDALNQFHQDDPAAGKKVDALVRGVDRALTSNMETLSQQIGIQFA